MNSLTVALNSLPDKSFLDETNMYAIYCGMNENEWKIIDQFFTHEHYDSDAIQLDVCDADDQSNIGLYLQSNDKSINYFTTYQIIKNFVILTQRNEPYEIINKTWTHNDGVDLWMELHSKCCELIFFKHKKNAYLWNEFVCRTHIHEVLPDGNDRIDLDIANKLIVNLFDVDSIESVNDTVQSILINVLLNKNRNELETFLLTKNNPTLLAQFDINDEHIKLPLSYDGFTIKGLPESMNDSTLWSKYKCDVFPNIIRLNESKSDISLYSRKLDGMITENTIIHMQKSTIEFLENNNLKYDKVDIIGEEHKLKWISGDIKHEANVDTMKTAGSLNIYSIKHIENVEQIFSNKKKYGLNITITNVNRVYWFDNKNIRDEWFSYIDFYVYLLHGENAETSIIESPVGECFWVKAAGMKLIEITNLLFAKDECKILQTNTEDNYNLCSHCPAMKKLMIVTKIYKYWKLNSFNSEVAIETNLQSICNLFFRFLNYSVSNLINDYQHVLLHNIIWIVDEEYHVSCANRLKQSECCFITEKRDRLKVDYSNFSFLQTLNTVHRYLLHSNKLLTQTEYQKRDMNWNDNQNGMRKIEISSDEIIMTTEQIEKNKDKFVIDFEIDEKETKEILFDFGFGENVDYWNESSVVFIKPKYLTLKEELIKNDIQSMELKTYYDIYSQAKGFILSQQSLPKRYCVGFFYVFGLGDLTQKYFNVHNGDRLTVNHMICLLVYTNYTDIQCKFKKKCFKTSTQTMESFFKQNASIANWCRYIMESCKLYGEKMDSSCSFYTGMSCKLIFKSFIEWFICPISTSSSREVAIRFAGEKGILLRLECTDESRYINAESFSAFSNENERLFCAAKLKITNIVNMQSGDNYLHFVNGIKLFNKIINGETLKYNYVSTKLCRTALCRLIREYMDDTNNKEKSYMQLMFTSLVSENIINSKKQLRYKIYLNVQNLNLKMKKKKLREYIFNFDENNLKGTFFSHLNLTNENVGFTNEFNWNLSEDEFKQYMDLEEGKYLTSNIYKYQIKEEKHNHQFISFYFEVWSHKFVVKIQEMSFPIKKVKYEYDLVNEELKYQISRVDYKWHTKDTALGVQTFDKSSMSKHNSLSIIVNVRVTNVEFS